MALRRARGQFIVGGVAFLAALLIVVQAMALWTNRETSWTKKETTSGRALNAANAGLQRAYWMLEGQKINWTTVQAGAAMSGYNFDKSYTDQEAATAYTVSVASSGPSSVDIVAVGKDINDGEMRAVQATYSRNQTGLALTDTVASAAGGFSFSGLSFQAEWGAVSSPQAITAAGRAHPQFWSAAGIDADANGPAAPNCDAACVQWHSYNSSVGAAPNVDLAYYKAQAQATGTYFSGAQTWKGVNFATGYTYYIDGDLNIQSPGDYVQGNVIVMGNLNLPSGAFGTGSVAMSVPANAWKQYGNDWSYYRATFDPSAPAVFPGLNGAYVSASTLTYTSNAVFVNGFLYVNGNMTSPGGGGSSDVYGAVIVNGSASLGASSHCTLFMNQAAAKTIQFSSSGGGSNGYVLTAWRETKRPWPVGL